MKSNVKITQTILDSYFNLVKAGLSQRQACKHLGISRGGIQYVLKNGLKTKCVEQSVEVEQPIDVVSKKERHLYPDETSKAKILFYDIETSLALSYHWGQWKQNLSHKDCVQPSHLLSHAWAWNGGEVTGSILTREEMLDHDPERLVLEAWSLFDNADIIVAHNAKKFDVRKVNAYFLSYGLPPPSPYKVIDTLQIAKTKFALPFNSLDFLARYLNVELKVSNSGKQLWIDCDRGKQEALDEMLHYNKGDITTLRDVYRKIIGWDNNGVNHALYDDVHDFVCTSCGSDKIEVMVNKFAYTPQRKYQVYRCKCCGANLRSNTKQGSGNRLLRII